VRTWGTRPVRWFTEELVVDLKINVEVRGIPHLAKNERDAPNLLYAALDKTAWAPFFKLTP
jgi:hypothetical protein